MLYYSIIIYLKIYTKKNMCGCTTTTLRRPPQLTTTFGSESDPQLVVKAYVTPNDLSQTHKNRPTLPDQKDRPIFSLTSFLFLGEYFFVRIGENPPIWVLHSPTITDYKKTIFSQFQRHEINVLIYNSGNNPTLLHKANDDTKKIGRFLQ